MNFYLSAWELGRVGIREFQDVECVVGSNGCVNHVLFYEILERRRL